MTTELTGLRAALLQAGLEPARLVRDARMADYTTLRVGGPADLLAEVRSPEELASALSAARETGTCVTVIGNGSNLLVRDGGIRGLVIRLGPDGRPPECPDGRSLVCWAGLALSSLASFALSRGLGGLAELSGSPGTLGGGVIMNAGAYGGELSQVVRRVEALSLSDGRPVLYEGDALGFGYRTSAMAGDGVVVTRAVLELAPADPRELRRRTRELAAARREKQPLELPSAGSAFKRPAGGFAAKMIDECGLRGAAVGGAQVSEKHAGFIVNRGGAAAADVLSLMALVRRRVEDRFGVTLEPEVRILGEDVRPHEEGE